MGTPDRVFLGWTRPPLQAIASWVVGEIVRTGAARGGSLVVATPGSRAARELLEQIALAAAGVREFYPPRIVTIGRLRGMLVEGGTPAASELERTCAWAVAIADADERTRRAIFGDEPPRTAGQLLAAGRRLASLGSDVHGEGRTLASVAAAAIAMLDCPDAGAWEAIGGLESRYEEVLVARGRRDADLEACRGLRLGRSDARIILAGVSELRGLDREVLSRLPDGAVTSLVLAPESEAGAFGTFGESDASAWESRRSRIAPDEWTVLDSPADAARAIVASISALAPGTRADEVLIGSVDGDISEELIAVGLDAGVRFRRASGVPLARSGPCLALEAVRGLCDRGGFRDLAALVRHPDIERWLAERAGPGLDASALPVMLDEAHAASLPEGLPARDRAPGPVDPGTWVWLLDALRELTGELWTAQPDARPMSDWADAIASMLARLYAREGVSERAADACEVIGRAIGEIRAERAAFGAVGGVRAAEAITFVLSLLAMETTPEAFDASSVELCGWLEVAMHPAKHLFLAGLAEGRVPTPVRREALLTEPLRRAAGLPGEDRRAARDAYLLELACSHRAGLRLMLSRRDGAGAPLVPSRLLTRGSDERAIASVERWVRPREVKVWQRDRAVNASEFGKRPPVRIDGAARSIRVSWFREYIRSPYGLFLQRIERLAEVDDSAEELDASGFGSIVHSVLSDFANEGPHDTTDQDAIAGWLGARVWHLGHERFGPGMRPELWLQLKQAEGRLVAYAGVHAADVAQGWRIRHTEWEPTEVVHIGSSPRVAISGRIDRIDFNEQLQEWRVLDYKTSASGQSPDKTHRARTERFGGWIDLQLPLYRQLAASLTKGGKVHLGYVLLPASPREVAIRLATWDENLLKTADDAAAEIAKRILSGDFASPGEHPPESDILAAICNADASLEEESDGGDEP
jgi:ATP-dependent helicase/nuclease subunit B